MSEGKALAKARGKGPRVVNVRALRCCYTAADTTFLDVDNLPSETSCAVNSVLLIGCLTFGWHHVSAVSDPVATAR